MKKIAAKIALTIALLFMLAVDYFTAEYYYKPSYPEMGRTDKRG